MNEVKSTIEQIEKASSGRAQLFSGDETEVITYRFDQNGRTLFVSFRDNKVSELYFFKNATESKKLNSVNHAIASLINDPFYGI
jgi:hypothetical protein